MAAGAIDHVILHPCLDAHDGAVGVGIAAVGQADELHGGLAEHLDTVAPATAVEVIDAPLPLGEQIGSDKPAQRDPVRAVLAVAAVAGSTLLATELMALLLIGGALLQRPLGPTARKAK